MSTLEEVLASIRISKNHYETLGVPSNIPATDLKKSYYKRSLLVHPDKNLGKNTDEAFKTLTQAYHVLKDPISRSAYDIKLQQERISTQYRPQQPFAPFSFYNSFASSVQNFSPYTQTHIFNNYAPQRATQTQQANPAKPTHFTQAPPTSSYPQHPRPTPPTYAQTAPDRKKRKKDANEPTHTPDTPKARPAQTAQTTHTAQPTQPAHTAQSTQHTQTAKSTQPSSHTAQHTQSAQRAQFSQPGPTPLQAPHNKKKRPHSDDEEFETIDTSNILPTGNRKLSKETKEDAIRKSREQLFHEYKEKLTTTEKKRKEKKGEQKEKEKEKDQVKEQPHQADMDGPEHYSVEKILSKKGKGGNLKYKVRWTGYGPGDDSWVLAKDCACRKLIAQFEKNLATSKSKENGTSPTTNNASGATSISKESGTSPTTNNASGAKSVSSENKPVVIDDEEEEVEIIRVHKNHKKRNIIEIDSD